MWQRKKRLSQNRVSTNVVWFLSFIVVATAVVLGCSKDSTTAASSTTDDTDDVVVATANAKTLRLSEVKSILPEGVSLEDSTLLTNAYIERWVRDALMLAEAEKNVPKDLNIDQLVRDYRASLILHNYEQLLVEQSLDSIITEVELNEYYEKNKDQYQLESNIIRFHFIKVSNNAPRLDKLKQWWEVGDQKKLIEYCMTHAESFMLKDSVWKKEEDVAAEFPKGTFNSRDLSSKKDITLKEGEFLYFLRVFDFKPQKEIAPLDYIRGQATKFILHTRKIKLLEAKKEELYEKAMKKQEIKIRL